MEKTSFMDMCGFIFIGTMLIWGIVDSITNLVKKLQERKIKKNKKKEIEVLNKEA